MESAPDTRLQSRPQSGNEDSMAGVLYALGAYTLWGFLPLYMKALSDVSPFEVVGHRILWSLPVAMAVLLWLGRTSDLKKALISPRMLAMAGLTAALLSANWGTYVWAVTSGHALDAALGYYINPLFSVLLGAILLGEKLRALQWLAFAMVAVGVGILTWEAGRLPVIAFALTLTWGFYAYFKKSLPIGANQGFALEVIVLLIPGLAILSWFAATGKMQFLQGPGWQSWMLLLLGVVTAGPLLLYGNGAKRLRLTTIAMMQYIAPTMIFLTAVFVFKEPFSQTKLLAFALIWAAVAVYSLSILRRPGA